ncbi:MAG: hypothetical protein V4506_01030, partial [Bacteroidota bacterium]
SVSGIQNDEGTLSVINIGGEGYFDDTYNQLRSFQTRGITSINDTIWSQNFDFLPANTTLTLSVEVGRTVSTTINGHFSAIIKWSVYKNFTTTKTN